MKVILGVDTGGTFTDFVLWRDGQLSIHKVLSTPAAPEQAILQGINDLGLDNLPANTPFYIVHGSTVATNAVLEGKGVSTAFITNQGFGDLLFIGRQARRELYALQPLPHTIPLGRSHCLETGGRLSATGEVIEPLTAEQLDYLTEQVKQLNPQSVAINLLFSYLDDQFERQIEQQLQTALPGTFICRSSLVLPEYKEYERGMTTWLNAYVGPLVKGYLSRLQQGAKHASISIMQSSGGTIAAEQAGDEAVKMLLSGPAGGLAAARYLGEVVASPRLLTFDMGGTSTDVAMIDGQVALTNESKIAGYPVAVPMVDMHTIGAGGGSIAYLDAGGVLQVGPESAGADPGPACYNRGGKRATVTDANLVLGRLQAGAFLGGRMTLNVEAAQNAVAELAEQIGQSIEETALGIIRIANEHMVQALRVISVQRGIDPRELRLVSFGGAGGLHVCALARELGMHQAMVPVHGGVLSALGMLVAPKARQLSRSLITLLEKVAISEMQQVMDELLQQGKAALIEEGVDETDINAKVSLDLRYQGQSYYLNVPWRDKAQSSKAFHELHMERYGHQLELPVELVNIRVAVMAQAGQLTLEAPASVSAEVNQDEGNQDEFNNGTVNLVGYDEPVKVYKRELLISGQTINGPALITETVSTTLIEEGWQATVHNSGCLLLEYAN